MQDSKSTNKQPRRGFLQGLVATAAGVTLAAPAMAKPATSAATVHLDAAKWSPRNREMVAAMIARNGSASKNYSAKRKPYAVFDWDNTSIMNDCEEALLIYQINHLADRKSVV